MMGNIKLDGRLQLIYEMVPEGSRVADIGCDHGHLICSLMLTGRIRGGIACDLREGPLSKAQALVREKGLEKNISLRLGNGLTVISPGEVDTVIIAGMGGEMIMSILQSSPWCHDERYCFLLQAMTKDEFLRRHLCAGGFEIADERAAEAGNRLYSVIKARYCGISSEADEVFCRCGMLFDHIQDEACTAYIEKKIEKLEKTAALRKKADRSFSEYEDLAAAIKKRFEEAVHGYGKRHL